MRGSESVREKTGHAYYETVAHNRAVRLVFSSFSMSELKNRIDLKKYLVLKIYYLVQKQVLRNEGRNTVAIAALKRYFASWHVKFFILITIPLVSTQT